MPRCGCLPAAPDTQPSPPQDLATLLHPPAPTSPFGVPEGYLSGQGLWGALPQQGAPGLSQGQTIPAQVPCPRKLEGHVSTSGVTPDMHPCTVAPLSRGLHSHATSYRSFCRCHHWTALAWNPWQGSRGQSSGCMGTGSIIASCRSGPRHGPQHQCSQASPLLCSVRSGARHWQQGSYRKTCALRCPLHTPRPRVL